MRSSSLYQIFAFLAAITLSTLPSSEALPVRGALGSLGARARAAKRAAHHHQYVNEATEKRFKSAPEVGKRPKNMKSLDFGKRAVFAEPNSVIESYVPIADAVPNIPNQANLAANQVIIEAASTVSSSFASASADAVAIYESYVAALDGITSTSLSVAPAPTSFIVAAVEAVPSSQASLVAAVDPQVAYDSYIAAMAEATFGP